MMGTVAVEKMKEEEAKNKIVIEENSSDDEEDDPVKITKKSEEKSPEPTKLTKQSSVEEQCKEDMDKKQRQQPAFNKILEKISSKKADASKLFRTGDYSGAIKLYLGVIEITVDVILDYPLFKAEVKREEASIYNNIAFAYGKEGIDTK